MSLNLLCQWRHWGLKKLKGTANICLKISLFQLHTHDFKSTVFVFHSGPFHLSPDFHNPYLKLWLGFLLKKAVSMPTIAWVATKWNFIPFCFFCLILNYPVIGLVKPSILLSKVQSMILLTNFEISLEPKITPSLWGSHIYLSPGI